MMNINVIDKLYELTLEDEFGNLSDSKEKVSASMDIEDYIRQWAPEMDTANELLGRFEYETGRQFFRKGFNLAIKMILNGSQEVQS